jgi:hypothetical protein
LSIEFNPEMWSTTWRKNYLGESPQSKELEKFMKANYKKHNYIPWATMVRMLYELDPYAELTIVTNDNHFTDVKEFVHTAQGSTEKSIFEEKTTKDGTTISSIERIENKHMANMVVVSCTFMGKVFVEYYPIQDNAYNAPNYYDSNMVNKAIQRAKAKIISIATGLAFRLYEDGDLQFEDDKPVVETKDKAITKVVEAVSSPTKKDETNVGKSTDDTPYVAANLISLLRKTDPDAVIGLLKGVNAEMVKLYGFKIDLSDTDDVLISNLIKIKNLKTFATVVTKKIEGISK